MTVDLSRPPGERWCLTEEQAAQARELLGVYLRDLGLPASVVAAAARPMIRDDHWCELEGLAASANADLDEVVCGNLYYDAMKAVLIGCTAFAVDTPRGPLHARNLDWWTENDLLRRHTLTTHFVGGSGGEFTTVGWPGFMGVFSGVAPGRFAVTLNAVVSDEPIHPGRPVVLLLRQILEQAPDFPAALALLRDTPLASDSLLLLTGTRTGEMAVIERTPRRAAVRSAENGRLVLTNDYRALPAGSRSTGSELQATACGRYDRIRELVMEHAPVGASDCLKHLTDSRVRMGITVQQMVFQAATGLCEVRS